MSTQNAIADRVDEFVADLTELIREAAMESVREAIGTPGATAPKDRRGPGRPKGSGRSSKAPARRSPARKSGKRVRRSAEDLEALSKEVQSLVSASPGIRMEGLAKSTGLASKDLRLPIQVMVADGVLKTKGQKRGTQYFPGRRAKSKR